MLTILFAFLLACDGDSKDDSNGSGDDGAGDDSAVDDSATDDSGTSKVDDSGKTDDSGTTDDSGGCPKVDWYQDSDGDDYGGGKPTSACDAPGTDWLQTGGDCDDALADVNPGATEVCNAIDDDCDLDIDDADSSVVPLTWYPDVDGDGYPDTSGTPVVACDPAGAYALEDAKHPADCDDADGSRYPGAPELCDDVAQGCVEKDWKGDVDVATWYPASGGDPEDWTADLTAGKYGSPVTVPILDSGELVICPGTYYAELIVGDTTTFAGPDQVTIRGLHGSGVTTISGGDVSAALRISTHDVEVVAEGLTMTQGNSCYGAAISGGSLSKCTAGGAGISYSVGIDVTLRDVRVTDNVPSLPYGYAAVYLVNGAVTLEDSTIANNSVYGFWGDGVSLTCSGDPKNDAGVWGNDQVGVLMQSWSTSPLLFESDQCDFDGVGGAYTPFYDVLLYSPKKKNTYDFGDDATFLCDASLVSCLF